MPKRHTTKSAAEYLGLSSGVTLKGWRSNGKGPRYVKIGGKVFYLERDLNAFIESNTIDPNKNAAA
jgi:hypothetical protein